MIRRPPIAVAIAMMRRPVRFARTRRREAGGLVRRCEDAVAALARHIDAVALARVDAVGAARDRVEARLRRVARRTLGEHLGGLAAEHHLAGNGDAEAPGVVGIGVL